jgi:diaminopimelate epimerase
MHGIGNDFVVVDDRADPIPESELASLASAVNNRRTGIGGDGLILIRNSSDHDYQMRMFNPDGSEAEMCGNGIRCVGKYAYERGIVTSRSVTVETKAGPIGIELVGEQVRVDMGPSRWLRGEIPVAGPPSETFLRQPVGEFEVTAVSMGNPHAVIFVPDATAVPLAEWGPRLENDPIFPARINVHFVQAVSRVEIIQRTWERGAGATLACGTGACACAGVGHRLDLLDDTVLVHLPGGDLTIEVTPSTIFMTGPAVEVFSGTFRLAPTPQPVT